MTKLIFDPENDKLEMWDCKIISYHLAYTLNESDKKLIEMEWKNIFQRLLDNNDSIDEESVKKEMKDFKNIVLPIYRPFFHGQVKFKEETCKYIFTWYMNSGMEAMKIEIFLPDLKDTQENNDLKNTQENNENDKRKIN